MQPVTDVQDCLRAFFQPRILSDYKCSLCHKVGNCEQEGYLLDPPQLFIVTLKRYNLSNPHGPVKNIRPIINNMVIDLENFVMAKGFPMM